MHVRSRTLHAVVAALVVPLPLALAACTGSSTRQDPAGLLDASVAVPASAAAGSVQPRAVGVLHTWDRRRATAYAAGDVAALRGLYLPGTRAGLRDVRALREYAGRGLVVRGLRTQLLRLEVRRDRARLVRLMVLDRVAAGRVVGPRTVVPLPRDAPDRRLVTLVRTPRQSWVVRGVRVVRAPR